MNKINPLYLLLFFVLAAILMMYKVSATESRITNLTQENARAEADGKAISQLKSRWKDNAAMQKRVDSILGMSNFNQNVTKRDRTKTTYKIVLIGLDNISLDAFTNKLLNEAIAIKSIEIERFSESNATVAVECEL